LQPSKTQRQHLTAKDAIVVSLAEYQANFLYSTASVARNFDWEEPKTENVSL